MHQLLILQDDFFKGYKIYIYIYNDIYIYMYIFISHFFNL